MTKYSVDILRPNPADEPIATTDSFSDAMTEAEQWCEQSDEQQFVAIWQDDNLVAIFDSLDWFTK